MGRFALSPDHAFAYYAAANNVKLHDIADTLIHTRQPAPPVSRPYQNRYRGSLTNPRV